MIVRRLSALLLALCLGALSAFAIACGEEREGLIASSRASDLQETLDRIDEYVAAGRCDAVTDNIAALRREVGDLPGSVDRDLRERLREGVEQLETQAPEECEMGTTTTETQPETTPETIPTETVPPDTTPEDLPPETTPDLPPETTPTPTTPPTPTVPPEGPPQGEPDDSGGEEAPQGQDQEQGQGQAGGGGQ